eukprot:209593_1
MASSDLQTNLLPKSLSGVPADDMTADELQYSNQNNVTIQNTDYFEWNNVNVTIEGKQILHSISGRVGSGQLLGILGGSGAGKTTLLNAISGRILTKKPSTLSNLCCLAKYQAQGTLVTGSVGYEETEFKLGVSDEIKHLSAYVMQHDIMCPTATCREALLFSSKLRSQNTPTKQLQIIESVTTSLKLTECQNTRVGNEAIRGMSGGEKKRTSVGVELVVQPSLVFLDEPTSGLDSFTALRTLEILKDLTAKQGKQVIATIHQPSSEIFKMIDILVLLAKGHCVYYGDAKNVLHYFETLGYSCPQYTNIADYVVNRIQENPDFFIAQWKKYETQYIDLNFTTYDIMYPQRSHNASFCIQFSEILKREWQILMRDPRPSKIRLMQTIIFSLIVGALYWQLPYDGEGERDRFGLIFFLSVNSSLTGLISTIVVFPEQRLLFEHERDANLYHTTTYLLAKLLIGLPEQALFIGIYQCICFWMIGFDSTFLELYIAMVLCTLSTGSVGLIVGCFAKNTGEAMQIMPVAFVPFMLFTNFMVSLDQIPAFIRWFQWLDPFKYIVDCLCITEFHDQLHHCNPETGKCIYDGNAFLKGINAGYKDAALIGDYIDTWMDSVYFDWIMLIVLTVGFRFIVWIILVKRNGF